MKKYNIYMGYDEREKLAYEVAEHSILKRTDPCEVEITPLIINEPPVSEMLNRPVEWREGVMWCPISEAPVSTDFAISRFLIPFIHKNGWALFMDCDMVCKEDIRKLFDLCDDKYAVMVVKHKHDKGVKTKDDGQPQTYYERKNWSSLVLWNCDHEANKRLTLENINNWAGRDLHAFKWLKDEEIGELPIEWNYLVDVTNVTTFVKMYHFTLGSAWYKHWKVRPSDKIWIEEYQEMKIEKLMHVE